ncbi:MAG: hypothetical protein ACTHKC_03835 [Candidatus Nitrosocosmicus sp.]
MVKFFDKFKEMTKEAKDKFVNTKNEAKDMAKSSTNSTRSGFKRQFEEGSAGTEVGMKDDPLTEYRSNEPMTPSKIIEHEPTAVKRDPSDQKITEQGQTGTNTEQANEQYRKKGMTKTDNSNS